MTQKTDWKQYDQQHLWHPYSSINNPVTPYPVVSASGVQLTLESGQKVIDGMASWWSAIHGYNVPELNEAATDQLHKMSHVMFGGLTHKPAVDLAEKLITLTPTELDYVFFADSGSIAVEVAIKMAIQYWHSTGQPKRKQLLTLRGGYHGDTFATMSLCDPENGMHRLFTGMLSQQHFAPIPQCRFGDEWDPADISEFADTLKQHKNTLAAVILEPIVQGAGGMRMYHAEYLRQVRALCNEHDVLLITDEIATGFGRSGTLFACEHAKIQPDILCLGKALTGGYMSLAATLTTKRIAQGISKTGALMHGPTFMANPLACAVANASIDLLLNSPWQQRVKGIANHFNEHLNPLKDSPYVEDVRIMGAIGVIEMKTTIDMENVQKRLVNQGVWLRPFGKLLYSMPPYTMNKQALNQLTDAMADIAQQPTN